jgi:hypothetical protein
MPTQHAHFSADKTSVEVGGHARVRPQSALAFGGAGFDQLAERRFEFIPLWRCGVVAVEEVP